MYRIVFSDDAKKDLKELNKKAPQAERNCPSFWKKSRSILGLVPVRLSHLLVYRIYEDVIEVLVLSAFGHYKK